MITVENVTKRYGPFTAVDDVTFTAEPGRVTGFLGPNGAGKSTTLRIIVGLTPPTTGRARVLGRNFADLPNPGLQVGVLLDASAQHAGRSGREILTLAGKTMGLPRGRVEKIVDLVGLTDDEAARRLRRLLPRHAATPRHRSRPARRPRGAHPRRARQRPDPAGHPVDARPAPRLRRPRRHRPALLPPAARDRSRRADNLVVIGHGRVVAAGPKRDLLAEREPRSAPATPSSSGRRSPPHS